MNAADESLLTRDEVAKILGVRPQTLRCWASKKQHLPVVKVGGAARYRRDDVEAFIAARTHHPIQSGRKPIVVRPSQVKPETKHRLARHGIKVR